MWPEGVSARNAHDSGLVELALMGDDEGARFPLMQFSIRPVNFDRSGPRLLSKKSYRGEVRLLRPQFKVFAGRAWPIDEDSDSLRLVAQFRSLAEARRAFSSVQFVPLPPRGGILRWRGWAPQLGMIIQIERAGANEPALPLAS